MYKQELRQAYSRTCSFPCEIFHYGIHLPFAASKIKSSNLERVLEDAVGWGIEKILCSERQTVHTYLSKFGGVNRSRCLSSNLPVSKLKNTISSLALNLHEDRYMGKTL